MGMVTRTTTAETELATALLHNHAQTVATAWQTIVLLLSEGNRSHFQGSEQVGNG